MTNVNELIYLLQFSFKYAVEFNATGSHSPTFLYDKEDLTSQAKHVVSIHE